MLGPESADSNMRHPLSCNSLPHILLGCMHPTRGRAVKLKHYQSILRVSMSVTETRLFGAVFQKFARSKDNIGTKTC